MENKKYWVIAFVDVKEEYYRESDDFGNLYEVMRFDSKEKVEKYIKTLDSREYDRYPKELTNEEIEEYDKE